MFSETYQLTTKKNFPARPMTLSTGVNERIPWCLQKHFAFSFMSNNWLEKLIAIYDYIIYDGNYHYNYIY